VNRIGLDALRTRRCECGAKECDAVIEMTWLEQDRADHVDGRWAIHPDHTPRGGRRWSVIEKTERFAIVEVEEEPVG
jgi:hypothetical protein